MTSKNLVVFDFDNTIVAENTDLIAFELIPSIKERDALYNQRKKEQWTVLMNLVFDALLMNNISLDAISTSISKIPLIDGMYELIRYLKATTNKYDMIIISDSNSWFIDIILKANGIDDVPIKIFTNAADFVNNEKLHITPCHSHNHTACPPNMCKGILLQKYVQECKLKQLEYNAIYYIGDGSNDYCPCTNLNCKDYVFPRQGYSLQIKLAKGETNAHVFTWENGHQILSQFNKIENECMSSPN